MCIRDSFEAVGISKEVIDKYFTGTVSRVGGISMADIQADVEMCIRDSPYPAHRCCRSLPMRPPAAPAGLLPGWS